MLSQNSVEPIKLIDTQKELAEVVGVSHSTKNTAGNQQAHRQA